MWCWTYIYSSSCTHIPPSPLLSQASRGAEKTWDCMHILGGSHCWTSSQRPTETRESAVQGRLPGLGVSVSHLPGSLEDKDEPTAWAESCFCCWVWGNPRNWWSGELPPVASTVQPALRGEVFVFLVEHGAHYITPTHILGLKNVVFQTNEYRFINGKTVPLVPENQVEIIFQSIKQKWNNIKSMKEKIRLGKKVQNM